MDFSLWYIKIDTVPSHHSPSKYGAFIIFIVIPARNAENIRLWHAPEADTVQSNLNHGLSSKTYVQKPIVSWFMNIFLNTIAAQSQSSLSKEILGYALNMEDITDCAKHEKCRSDELHT